MCSPSFETGATGRRLPGAAATLAIESSLTKDASQTTSRNSIHRTRPRCHPFLGDLPRTKTSPRTITCKAQTADCGKCLLWKLWGRGSTRPGQRCTSRGRSSARRGPQRWLLWTRRRRCSCGAGVAGRSAWRRFRRADWTSRCRSGRRGRIWPREDCSGTPAPSRVASQKPSRLRARRNRVGAAHQKIGGTRPRRAQPRCATPEVRGSSSGALALVRSCMKDDSVRVQVQPGSNRMSNASILICVSAPISSVRYA
jgi:hypothetical protein